MTFQHNFAYRKDKKMFINKMMLKKTAAVTAVSIFALGAVLAVPAQVSASIDVSAAVPVKNSAAFKTNNGIYSSWDAPVADAIPHEYANKLTETPSTQYIVRGTATNSHYNKAGESIGVTNSVSTVFDEKALASTAGITITNLKYYNAAAGTFDMVDETIMLDLCKKSDTNTRTDKMRLAAIRHTPAPSITLWGCSSLRASLSFRKAGTDVVYPVKTNITMSGIQPSSGCIVSSKYRDCVMKNQIVSADSKLDYFRNSNEEDVYYNSGTGTTYNGDAATSFQYVFSAGDMYMYLFDNGGAVIDDSTEPWEKATSFTENRYNMASSEIQTPTLTVSDKDEFDATSNTFDADDETMIFWTGEFVNGGIGSGSYFKSFGLDLDLPAYLKADKIVVLRDGVDITNKFDVSNVSNKITASAKKSFISGSEFYRNDGSRYVLTVTASRAQHNKSKVTTGIVRSSVSFDTNGSAFINGKQYKAPKVTTKAFYSKLDTSGSADDKTDAGNTGSAGNTNNGSSIDKDSGVNGGTDKLDPSKADEKDGASSDSALKKKAEEKVAARAASASSPQTGDPIEGTKAAVLVFLFALVTMTLIMGEARFEKSQRK
mgnify:CR=1 FL=1